MNWTVYYYNERVKRAVLDVPASILASYLRLLELMQEFGADLRMPYSRAMGDGLFELRPEGSDIGRVLYCTEVGRSVIVLHSFVKKTRETPLSELRTGRTRLKEINQ
ncbi:type II toxin-antitoxin system RelE/ParE family toxin [Paraburkholderia flava]|uniref:type II toxin-antitoxin system RelE/ParE family toxin n=1 Tax=Paraburkholderia flava TaxID=2547393 RepID=UPI00105E833D|nr:type II toxin-antitoxin system RelE/ParE family toxin [Paraburkholderia flava]